MTFNPAEILEESKSLYQAKENDYGESWRLTGKIMYLLLSQRDEETLKIPVEPEYLTALGLYTRRIDKLVRSFNGTFLEDELEVDESVEETVKDQVPYAAMHAALTKELQQVTVEEEPDASGETPEGWACCPECDELAADRTKLVGTPQDYEYYCECGHAWWE